MDDTLVNSLASPVNSVQQGYQNVNSQLRAAQDLHDNNMLKVFEFAGDGQVDAAKAFAQSKNIQIPPEVLSNADLAQGLAIAGKVYGKDPNAAQKFTTAWMQNQGMPLQQRVLTSSNTAGAPIDPEDRKFRGMIAMLQWKKDNLPNSGQKPSSFNPHQSRFNAGQKAWDTVTMQGPLAAPGDAEKARDSAYAEWDKNFQNASPGLMGGTADDSPDSPADIDEYGNTIHQPAPDQGGYSAPAPAASAAPSPAAALASPAPATSSLPSGLPAGSAMIGTSGGKPVYRDPQGNQYIDNGNH